MRMCVISERRKFRWTKKFFCKEIENVWIQRLIKKQAFRENVDKLVENVRMWIDCIRAPPRRGMDWEIHPRRPRFPETREISRGRSPREISRVEGNLERFPAVMGFAPRDPRDFPRAKPEGNPEGRGVQNP